MALNQCQSVVHFKNIHVPQVKVLPRLELGSLDSKSKVLTIAPQGPIKPKVCPFFLETTLLKPFQGEVAIILSKTTESKKHALLCNKHFTVSLIGIA